MHTYAWKPPSQLITLLIKIPRDQTLITPQFNDTYPWTVLLALTIDAKSLSQSHPEPKLQQTFTYARKRQKAPFPSLF